MISLYSVKQSIKNIATLQCRYQMIPWVVRKEADLYHTAGFVFVFSQKMLAPLSYHYHSCPRVSLPLSLTLPLLPSLPS